MPKFTNTTKLLLSTMFSEQAVAGDDTVLVCKVCGRGAWTIESIPHKKTCILAKSLKEIGYVE